MREALRRLEGDGHVVRDRSGGVRPNAPRVSVMRELYDVRIVLEDLAVRTADPARLDALHAEWQELRSERDESPGLRVRRRGLPRGAGALRQRRDRALPARHQRAHPVIRIHDFTTPTGSTTTVEEHLEILDALRAGRTDAAAALMRVHIERSAEVVERRVGELLARMFEEARP